MIALDGEPLDPAEAARRAARGADPFWLSSPGPDADVGVACDYVGCDPVRVVGDEGGRDVDALEEVWRAERRAWAEAGTSSQAVPLRLPIGVGFLSYDLGRRWIALPSRAADDHGWPELEFRFHDAIWMRDATSGAARIVARDAAAARRLADRLANAAPGAGAPPAVSPLRAGAATLVTWRRSSAFSRIWRRATPIRSIWRAACRRRSVRVTRSGSRRPCVPALPRRTRSGSRATAGAIR